MKAVLLTALFFASVAANAAVSKKDVDNAVKIVRGVFPGESHYTMRVNGPYLKEGAPGVDGVLTWAVYSDARGDSRMTQQAEIPLARYFDSFDAKRSYIVKGKDNVRHADRVSGIPVERKFQIKRNVAYFTQHVNFDAKNFHKNRAYPSTKIFIAGKIKADAEIKPKPEPKKPKAKAKRKA